MDPEGRGSRLAARFKAGLDVAASAEQARLDAAGKRRERGNRERTALLVDLAKFGNALGHFKCARGRDGSITWSHAKAQLSFKPVGDADRIALVAEPLTGEAHIRWQHDLGRWVLIEAFKAGGERQRLLYDDGIQALMFKVFGLRPMAEGEQVEQLPETTLEDALPTARGRKL
jgi:hypothetical protein